MVVVRASIAFPMWGESWHRHCLSELPKTAPIEGRWYYKERGLLWAAEKERVNIVCHHHHHQDDAWRRGWQHPKEDASVWYIVPPERWGVFYFLSQMFFTHVLFLSKFEFVSNVWIKREGRDATRTKRTMQTTRRKATLLVLTVVPTVTQHLCRHIVACH